MSSAAKQSANVINAQSSTGPRTEEGKAACSKNATAHGLYARRDFIRPGEEPDYEKLQTNIQAELAPLGVIEQTLVDEIRRAMWRLRRCGQVEANLIMRLDHADRPQECYIPDAMETSNPHAEKIQKSVDRARSQAHRLLHKCTAEIRKLQTDRQFATELFPAGADHAGFGLMDWRTLIKGLPAARVAKPVAKPVAEPDAKQSQTTPEIARNAACPCQSGLKFKRCCGKSAPPVLQAA